MPWTRLDSRCTRHPKTVLFRKLLGEPLAEAYLMRLWNWTMDFMPSGDLTGISAAVLAEALGYAGEPEKLLEALVQAGWIDTDGETMSVHDWDEWGGQYERSVQARRKRQARSRGKSGADDADTTRTRQGRDEDTTLLEESRGEKRRREETRETHADMRDTRQGPALATSRRPGRKRSNARKEPRARVGDEPADQIQTEFVAFKDWAYKLWHEAGGEGSWSPADWTCLHRGLQLIGEIGKARESWSRYLQDASSFYQGHYPKKWSSEPARWLQGNTLPTKTAGNIAAARAFISKEGNP